MAIDCETMGLNPKRDRLCVVQLSNGNGDAHLVQFNENFDAPNLKKLLSNPKTEKIFHFGRFDLAAIQEYLGLEISSPVYCTKIASKLARTYTDRHGLKDVCKELINIEISKQQQSSNWGADTLSDEQIDYAASDVLYLHQLRDKLNEMLEVEGRMEMARKCFDFLPTRASLDLMGWADHDIFSHAAM